MRSLELAEEHGYTLYTYEELEDLYEDTLNEIYGVVSICGYSNNSGHLLRRIDPIAFRCGCSDWSSEEFEEIDGGGAYMRKDDYARLVQELEDEE